MAAATRRHRASPWKRIAAGIGIAGGIIGLVGAIFTASRAIVLKDDLEHVAEDLTALIIELDSQVFNLRQAVNELEHRQE